jgi:hypothetical protein
LYCAFAFTCASPFAFTIVIALNIGRVFTILRRIDCILSRTSSHSLQATLIGSLTTPRTLRIRFCGVFVGFCPHRHRIPIIFWSPPRGLVFSTPSAYLQRLSSHFTSLCTPADPRITSAPHFAPYPTHRPLAIAPDQFRIFSHIFRTPSAHCSGPSHHLSKPIFTPPKLLRRYSEFL